MIMEILVSAWLRSLLLTAVVFCLPRLWNVRVHAGGVLKIDANVVKWWLRAGSLLLICLGLLLGGLAGDHARILQEAGLMFGTGLVGIPISGILTKVLVGSGSGIPDPVREKAARSAVLRGGFFLLLCTLVLFSAWLAMLGVEIPVDIP